MTKVAAKTRPPKNYLNYSIMFAKPRPKKSVLPPPSKKRKYGVEEVSFDFDARQEYLTGFHKRKQQRIKLAQEEAAKRAREERLRTRKQVICFFLSLLVAPLVVSSNVCIMDRFEMNASEKLKSTSSTSTSYFENLAPLRSTAPKSNQGTKRRKRENGPGFQTDPISTLLITKKST